jgi:hypothetical protein
MKAGDVFLLVLLFAPLSLAQTPATPTPGPGIRQGERADAQAQRNIPPPVQRRNSVDPAQLQRDADALAILAASIPPEVSKASNGILPKDLPDQLRQIEKLAKRLRSEITH